MEKTANFLKGLLLGAVAGGVAGVLLAPKSGKETRDDIMKLAEKVKKDATSYFEDAKTMLMQKVDALKAAGKKLDEKKYLEIVTEVVDELKKDRDLTMDAAKKIGTQLKRDWRKIENAFSPEKATTKK